VRKLSASGLDFGGCRCQAFALTGDARATDPVWPPCARPCAGRRACGCPDRHRLCRSAPV